MTHSSIKLSKAFKEAGFEGESEMAWLQDKDGTFLAHSKAGLLCSRNFNEPTYLFPAYDLLWDLCIRYGEDYIFGGSAEEKFTHMGMVFHMLISGKDPEQYILDNSILFNKNNGSRT